MCSQLQSVLLALLSAFAVISTVNSKSDTANLIDKFNSSNILLAGVLEHKLYFITKGSGRNQSQPKVFEFPVNKLTQNSLDIHGVDPVDIETKWPVVTDHDPYYPKYVATGKVQIAVAVEYSNKPQLFFSYNESIVNHTTFYLEFVTYSIDPEAQHLYKYTAEGFNTKEKINSISSNQANIFYGITKASRDNASFSLMRKYKISYDQVTLKQQWKLCQKVSNQSTVIVFQASSSNCDKIDWNIEGGFVYHNLFYLFDTEIMYIFNQTTVERLSGNGYAEVEVLTLKDFLGITSPKLTPINWLVVVLLGGLVLTICVVSGLIILRNMDICEQMDDTQSKRVQFDTLGIQEKSVLNSNIDGQDNRQQAELESSGTMKVSKMETSRTGRSLCLKTKPSSSAFHTKLPGLKMPKKPAVQNSITTRSVAMNSAMDKSRTKKASAYNSFTTRSVVKNSIAKKNSHPEKSWTINSITKRLAVKKLKKKPAVHNSNTGKSVTNKSITTRSVAKKFLKNTSAKKSNKSITKKSAVKKNSISKRPNFASIRKQGKSKKTNLTKRKFPKSKSKHMRNFQLY